MKTKITVGVIYASKLTPDSLQRIGGKLSVKTIVELVDRVRRGTTDHFSIGLGDGITVEYPATDKSSLRVEC